MKRKDEVRMRVDFTSGLTVMHRNFVYYLEGKIKKVQKGQFQLDTKKSF